MSAAQVQPPRDPPWCAATVREITRPADGWGPERPSIRCEVRGYPDAGGVYYWTPAQARAIFVALRAHNVMGDTPACAPVPEVA